jgi:hypothetical protein
MTFSIGIRPLTGVPVLDLAVAVLFVAVAGPAGAAGAVRVAAAAAFERAGRVAGVFGGVARLLFVLIVSNVSGGGSRREIPGDLRNEIASVPVRSMWQQGRWTLVQGSSASVWSCP